MDGSAPYYAPSEGDDPFARPGELPGPVTPAVATLSADGSSLYLVIANGSWERAIPCRVKLRGFRPTRAAAVALAHRDPDGSPLLERKEDAVSELPVQVKGEKATCTLPPYSVVFITLQQR